MSNFSKNYEPINIYNNFKASKLKESLNDLNDNNPINASITIKI